MKQGQTRANAQGSKVLAIGLMVSAALYVSFVLSRFSSARTDVFNFLALQAILWSVFFFVGWWLLQSHRASVGTPWRLIALGALVFRVVLLFVGLQAPERLSSLQDDVTGTRTGYETFLLYDNDVWRYLWDGKLLAEGASPYAETPVELEDRYAETDADATLNELFEGDPWFEVYDNLSFTSYTTVYGPLAQSLFAIPALLGSGSVLVFKLLLLAFDLGVCWLLWRLLERRGSGVHVYWYAWNPLVLLETIGSAHVDVVLVFFVVLVAWSLDRQRYALAWLALGLAALVKVTPLLLLPWLWAATPRAAWVRCFGTGALVAAAGMLPFLRDVPTWIAGVSTFAREWEFNPGPWQLFLFTADTLGFDDPRAVARGVTYVLLVGLGVACALWQARRAKDVATIDLAPLLILLAAAVWLTPTVNPWYLLWALPFAIATGFWPWHVLCGLSLVSYLYYIDEVERVSLLGLEHGAFAVCAALWLWLRLDRSHSRPHAP